MIQPAASTVVDPDGARADAARLQRQAGLAAERPRPPPGLLPRRRGAATSLYLWIPLTDTDARNGTLHVVPGSHRFANKRPLPARPCRPSTMPSTDVHEASVRLDCRAGDLVLMVSGVIHHSPPTSSDEVRLAAHGILIPVDVPLVFYYADDDTPQGQVECYELDLEGYVRHIHAGPPRPRGDPQPPWSARPPGSMTRERFTAGVARHTGPATPA